MHPIYLKYLIYFISGSILITAITLIAEKKSPKIAGIMMSLPVITFLSLLFLALSQGPDFAARAAVWNPIGAIADLIYMGLFAVGINPPESLWKSESVRKKKIIGLSCGLLFGFTGYFISILISSGLPIDSGWVSLAALWAAAIIAYTLFGKMPESKVEEPKLPSGREVIVRGLFGGSVVAAAVILGDSFGYLWGGLFSSFPGTITPVLVLLHIKNGKDMTNGVIKSAPIGLSATGLYSCMVWLLYPTYGVVAGTLGSYLGVLIFLSVLAYACD